MWWPEPCILSLHGVGCIVRSMGKSSGIIYLVLCPELPRVINRSVCTEGMFSVYSKSYNLPMTDILLRSTDFLCEKMCIINWYRPFHFRISEIFEVDFCRNIVFSYYLSKFYCDMSEILPITKDVKHQSINQTVFCPYLEAFYFGQTTLTRDQFIFNQNKRILESHTF